MLQESDKGQIFYWSIQTCSRIRLLFVWLIVDCHHARKTSKLPYFRLFRPDTQILSALTALYWPSIAFYWPSTTKYQPVPPYNDALPLCVNHYRPLLIQYHQVPTSIAHWPSTIMYWPVPPSIDPVPPSTNCYRLLLTQYHHISTSTAFYWLSTTKYQPVPLPTDPVYQVPTYTVVAWGLQTPAQFTPGLVLFGNTSCLMLFILTT